MGEIVDMWESNLFCLGRVEIVFGLFMLGGDTLLSMFFVSLLIDLYLWVIHWYMSLFCAEWNQEFILFICIFHTCVYAFCLSVPGNIQVDSIELLSILATNG